MEKIVKKIVQKILRHLAVKVIRKYKPFIIGITGSVGKSSTKEAIYVVLKDKFRVRRSLKNYNNELGLPLTILGRMSPGKSLAGWLRVFWMAIGSIWFLEKTYPKILVLEMAADHPGDIKYLTKIAPCQVGVVTAIGPSHLEFFKNIENVIKEKQIIVSHLPSRGWAILNADDPRVLAMKEKAEAKILTFGLSEKADVRAVEIEVEQDLSFTDYPKINGLRFKMKYSGSVVPVFLPKILNRSAIYSVLAAAAVGLIFDLNLIEISETLKDFELPPGRMKPIIGFKNTLIIDDTYNSSPKATVAALETLEEIKVFSGAKKWVVLGDMLELGDSSENEHRKIGEIIAEKGFDYLLTFGQEVKYIAEGAKDSGMNEEKIKIFDNQQNLSQFLKNNLSSGDVILVKGSQGMRMENIVKEIMAEPQKARQLLVRQTEEWL
ncbi:MAG: UDP-N-acetylmuramoyl-tripeptide--D-alanyl-D-alanine ligase [Patescibacteria group bacterium]